MTRIKDFAFNVADCLWDSGIFKTYWLDVHLTILSFSYDIGPPWIPDYPSIYASFFPAQLLDSQQCWTAASRIPSPTLAQYLMDPSWKTMWVAQQFSLILLFVVLCCHLDLYKLCSCFLSILLCNVFLIFQSPCYYLQ